jgi:hypothetical protein
MNNQNTLFILILLNIILTIVLFSICYRNQTKLNIEGYEASKEAVENLASVLNTGNMKVTNLEVTGKVKAPGTHHDDCINYAVDTLKSMGDNLPNQSWILGVGRDYDLAKNMTYGMQTWYAKKMYTKGWGTYHAYYDGPTGNKFYPPKNGWKGNKD